MVLKAKIKRNCGVILLAAVFSLACYGSAPARTYQNGFSIVLKLGGELFESLPQKFSSQIDPQAIALQPQDLPVVTPIATTENKKILRQVSLSAGFIDLANHICHAKAADRVEPGFFQKYVRNLAQITLADPAAPLPQIVDPKLWTDAVINDQMSYFNQMISFVMAINLSHLYLGHYDKYSSEMIGSGDKLVPINDFLTEAEWDVSVRAAVIDNLNCALATDGTRALFEAIDIMPRRPAWTEYVIPAKIDIKKLNQQLAQYESDFFHGHLKQ
ncbi:MAG TPA: hypothetical protein VH595_21265 [Verrucomicrobiae bacterium]|jgi:hypothetical protein|nr:hypothetical protein [Verrucomicrobiae bacterium]